MKKIFYKKIILISAIFFSLPFLTNAAAIGDGIFIYDQTTPTTAVQSRTWVGSNGSVGAEVSPFAGSGTSKHIYTRSSQTRPEILLGIQDSAGLLTIYMSNDYGATWTSQWTATVGDGNLKRFEIAYEQTSGDAIVIYGGNVATTNEIKYQTWNGTSWSGALNLDAIRTTGTIYGIRAAERSGSNEIGIVWVDTNLDISANVWTGTAWYGEPTAALSTSISRSGGATPSTVPTRRGYDIAFESLSGELMVVWGNDSGSTTQVDPRYILKTAGGAWGAAAGVAITALTEDGEMIDIAPSPISDKIALSTCSIDTGADCNSIMWSGTAWGTVVSDTTSAAAIAGESSNNVDWLVDGTNEVTVITYSDAAGGGIDWYRSIGGATPVVQTDNTLAPAIAGLERAGFSKVNPANSKEAIFIFEDANADIFIKKATLSGTTVTWSNPTGLSTAIETAASVTGFNPIGFAFVRYVQIDPPTVTTQAVTDNTTGTTATGNGNVTSDGGGTITERGFVWNTSIDPTTSNSKVIVAGTTGSYTGNITGLSPSTFYYVRAYAINSAGTSYGDNVSFTTVSSVTLPVVSTQSVTNISSTTATGSGNITDIGGENNDIRGVVYHTSSHANPGNIAPSSSLYPDKVEESGSFNVGVYLLNLTGLTASTTYYLRAYSHNSAGYSYGDEVSFSSLTATLPVSGVLTSSVYDTTANTTSVGYNSIMWKGALGGAGFNEGKVRFQLAASSSSTGPWNYYGGSTCGSLDWFDPGGPNIPIELKGASCLSAWNNKRYYRYKVQICSNNCVTGGPNSPTVNSIIVNWSP